MHTVFPAQRAPLHVFDLAEIQRNNYNPTSGFAVQGTASRAVMMTDHHGATLEMLSATQLGCYATQSSMVVHKLGEFSRFELIQTVELQDGTKGKKVEKLNINRSNV